MAHDLPKAYEPADIEKRWAEYWVKQNLFHVATPAEGDERPVFTLLLPPPNVTGRLHMGHMLNQTEMDIIIRWHRMLGDITLWLPGTDHAGIATQMMVERQLASEGKKRTDLGREKFIERVWEWRAHYGGAILDQMKRLGASVDWSREYFTMDDNLSHAVREVFVRLYDEGLIYRGKYIVNWCPRCVTAISDLEVKHEDTPGKLYEIRYPVIGAENEYITVATTRPETMLGDTAVAVNQRDERYRHLHGKKVLLPLMNREIPIILDDLAQPEFGTGAVKVTPAHDPNDYQAGLRHDLPQINIMDEHAVLNENAGPYTGLDRHEARHRVLADLEKGGWLVGTKDYTVPVGKCDRCKTVVEPRLSTQWFVAVNKEPNTGGMTMAKAAIEAVTSGAIRFTPENYKTIYLNWMENIYDWCISRQLWWGHRIPAWHCSKCHEITVARETPQQCKHCACGELTQDPDVLDTWFSSALLPFTTLGWPEATRDLEAFYPTSLLITGFDILFFWVARMIMMGCHFMMPPHRPSPVPKGANALAESVPYKEVYIHALVRDAERQKMSKTKGNVLDPIEVIEKYGTDATRFTLASMASPGTDIAFNPDRTEGYRAFANKIWNAARFMFGAIRGANPPAIAAGSNYDGSGLRNVNTALLEDRWILSRFNQVSRQVNEALQAYRFHEAANAVYAFFWGELCDWYIELVKPRMVGRAGRVLHEGSLEEKRVASVAASNFVTLFEGALRLLSPFMPFITEEVWHAMYDYKPPLQSIALARYPRANEDQIDRQAETDMAILQDLIVSIRNIRAELKVDQKAKVPIEIHAEPEIRRLVESNAAAVERLTNSASMDFVAQSLAKEAGSRTTARFEVRVVYQKKIDVTLERARLRRELARLRNDVRNADRQLSNESFLSKAPLQLVEKLKIRSQEGKALITKLWESLDQLPIEKATVETAIKRLEYFLNSVRSAAPPTADDFGSGSLSIFDGITLTGEDADELFEVTGEFYSAVEKNGVLSRSGVEDIVKESVARLLKIDKKAFEQELEEEKKRLRKALTASPRDWKFYIRIYGFELGDRRDFTFGTIDFSPESPHVVQKIRTEVESANAKYFADPSRASEAADRTLGMFGHEPKSTVAEVSVRASDFEAAKSLSIEQLRSTLDVMNFFLNWSIKADRMVGLGWERTHSLENFLCIEQDADNSPVHLQHEHRGLWIPMDAQQILENRAFQKASELLGRRSPNSFSARVIASLRWAGRASTQERRDQAFLFYMIALETALLGSKKESDIGYRVRIRAAHLLGTNVYGRKKIAEYVKLLYDTRSRIVHAGTAVVSEGSLGLALRFSKDAALILLMDPRFQNMTSEAELEGWFDTEVLE